MGYSNNNMPEKVILINSCKQSNINFIYIRIRSHLHGLHSLCLYKQEDKSQTDGHKKQNKAFSYCFFNRHTGLGHLPLCC